MSDLISFSVDNLLSPMILFFLLGLAAGLARSNLAIPEQISKFLAVYLILAIGFKGGVALASAGEGVQVFTAMLLAAVLSAVLPLLAYGLLRLWTSADQPNAAAIAAHYGSVSVVTFVAGTAFLHQRGETFEGYLVAMLAMMEMPAVIVGILLARRSARTQSRDSTAGSSPRQVLHEAVLSGSVVLLLGSLVIGWLTGSNGMKALEPFIDQPFKGVLSLFLLDMGILTAQRLLAARGIEPRLLLFGIYMPLLGAATGLLAGSLIGLSAGGIMLVGVLTASASYIVVPAAVRLAIPQADPAQYMTLSLGVTFPFNVVLGIPIYYAAARFLSVS